MAFTYDPTTALGQVRLLCGDTDSTTPQYTDDEVNAFLTLNGSIVKLAAAQALDRWAERLALIQGRTRIAGIMVDGPAVAERLGAHASELRRQYNEGDGESVPAFDVAELVYDVFSYRDRLTAEMERESS